MPIASGSWPASRIPGDPAPLVKRREDERQRAEDGPAAAVRHPREPDVQQQQVREQRDRPVLAGRQQDRRGESAEQAEHGDEQRIVPDREQHRRQASRARASPKATEPGIRFQCEWAAKNVANRIAMAAASMALASNGYLRAALRSQTTSSAIATMMPIAKRTGGRCKQTQHPVQKPSRSSSAGRKPRRRPARCRRWPRTASRRPAVPSRTTS